MGCKDRHEETSYGNNSLSYQEEKALEYYNENQEMTPLRKWLCEKLPIETLSIEQYEKLLTKIMLGQPLSKEEQLGMVVHHYSEKYKGHDFNKKRLQINDVVFHRSGCHEHAYIVKEVYFDGTYKVVGYENKSKSEFGETIIMSHYYLEIVQNTDSQTA